jgi:hypothetical protein
MSSFKELFEKADPTKRDKAKKEIMALVKGNKRFEKMKKAAKKSSDNVPDFLDYVYTVYQKDIDKLSAKYGIEYDELAQMFIAS